VNHNEKCVDHFRRVKSSNAASAHHHEYEHDEQYQHDCSDSNVHGDFLLIFSSWGPLADQGALEDTRDRETPLPRQLGHTGLVPDWQNMKRPNPKPHARLAHSSSAFLNGDDGMEPSRRVIARRVITCLLRLACGQSTARANQQRGFAADLRSRSMQAKDIGRQPLAHRLRREM